VLATELVTADTTIGRVGKPVRIYHINILSGGGGGGVVNLRNGTVVGDPIWVQEVGTVSQGVSFSFNEGLLLPAGCFVDIDANVTSVAVTFHTEN
jgi:hypothetical protein